MAGTAFESHRRPRSTTPGTAEPPGPPRAGTARRDVAPRPSGAEPGPALSRPREVPERAREAPQRAAEPPPSAAARFNSAPAGQAPGGRPLPPSLRTRMEKGFSADFSAVRIHDDAAAHARAAALGTEAFTEGSDIYLGADAVAEAAVLAHELAHVQQAAAGGVPTLPVSERGSVEEVEATAAADRVLAGGQAGPLHPSRAAIMRDGPGTAVPLLRVSDQFVQVPGKPGYYPIFPGAPFDPEALVILLRIAVAARRSTQRLATVSPVLALVQQLTTEQPELDVPEVLRLGDRASWVQARSMFETQTGATLLGTLEDVLSDKEIGAALPYLRGVVPSADLIRVWSGTFSTDVPGILRVLERMPDTEALGFVVEYRTLGAITGTTARSLATTLETSLEGEEGGAYTAIRTLARRMERLGDVVAAQVTQEDRTAAKELAGELRVLAAFARVKEADRKRRADWAYLAVVDLDRRERDGLDISYLSSWKGSYLTGARRRSLENQLRSTLDDADRILATIERASLEASERGHEPSEEGLERAASALGPALARLAARAEDPKVPEDERIRAQERLTLLAGDEDIVERVLGLPGGERIARAGLGISASEVARRRVLRATTVSEVVDALRGLHGVEVGLILARPDVEAHLAEEELVINPGVRRVLDAYGELAGARIEPVFLLPAGTTFLAPGTADIAPEDEDLAPVLTAGGGLSLTVVRAEPAEDALVVVAAYEAYRAARDKDVAGVMAAVRGLRPSQRALLQDDEFFQGALRILEKMYGDAPQTVATVLADPSRNLGEASTALIAGGLMGEPGFAFDVQDERMLMEGLAVDPADRRLMRYRYVLDELGEEDRLAGISDYFGRRTALAARGVPMEFELPSELDTAYRDRQYAIDRLDPTPKLRMEEVFLGEPEVLRADLTPEEAALEAQFMRIRLDRHLEALARGVDASGVFGWSPETVRELTEEFRKTFADLGGDGRWTREELVKLAAAYYDVLDAADRNRSERNSVAEFVGTLAATVAGVVVIVATGGTATPLVVAMLAGAVLGAGAKVIVADAFRDYTSPDQALADLGSGAVTGALTVAGDALARPAVAIVSRQMAGFAAKGAVNRAIAGGARLAVEGAIDGAVGGAGEAVFRTAIDKRTWERGVAAVFTRFLSAAVEGAFFGGLTGAVAAPVIGGGVAGGAALLRGARRLLNKSGVALANVPTGAADGLERVAALADSGKFDVALRRLDEVPHLSGADRDRITQELYRRALASGEEGAAVPPDMLRRLDEARRVVRSLEYEAGPPKPGQTRPRLEVAPVEDLLRKLEKDLGPAEVAHVRKIVYGEIRMAPEELFVKQAAFEKGMRDALDELLTPAERAALPPFEVRVLPPEAFEGMFRSAKGRALTLVEGEGAVVYVRSDAPVRAHMLQEAAHLRQLADPATAADVRLLAERNVLDWAGKSAEDRLHLLDVQFRLEIDAQERIIKALEREAPYADDILAANQELDLARRRLAELRRHEAEARAITPDQLSEMNAGIRHRPAWMDEESRLFGTEVVEAQPATPLAELKRTAVQVSDSTGLKAGERAFKLGETWPKTTYTTSGVDGTVESITTVTSAEGRPATAVTVAPSGGGESRVYLIETTTPGSVDVAVGTPVRRGDRLGREVQQYRLVEVRKTGVPNRLREEVLDVKGRWVERGRSRSTKGTVLEEAAELQEAARLSAEVARVPTPRGRKPRVRAWFKVEFPPQRRGFDRVFVEFHGVGADTVAVVRVLEVKHYPGSYVPFGEFTAITTNFPDNVAQLRGILKKEVTRLAKAGDADAARALQAALDEHALVIEVWLGPGTKMGAESVKDSVLSKLRSSVEGRGTKVKLAAKPSRVTVASQKQAVAARAAKSGKTPVAPPPASGP
jgi:hypothetical protein